MFNLQTTLVEFEYQKKLKTCIINKIGLSIGVTHKRCLHVRGKWVSKKKANADKGRELVITQNWTSTSKKTIPYILKFTQIICQYACIYTTMAASIYLENV